ncbi:NAD(P)H dehydrogenase (quinone) [Blastococcus colisei]|uniref:NAD(P)H dehydrogenase (Quinone) n=1 Tax=Blastococcus colisei TaxID=1564162 RepID=A0A543PEL1_9ACTN|nr:SDR family oxidoreductase [Blastococcus colisei]TQN42479.1 NAD(P)H dehydrogenase (quinone) [Blastococcus colisei]
MSIVVPATSGHLGRLIVTDLLERGVPAGDIVAGARKPEVITDLADAGVRTVRIDYDDPASVESAISPGDTFVLISGAFTPDRTRQHADAITAAKRAGTGHLLYVGALRAAESASPLANSHAPTEVAVRDSGLPFTFLRNGWYTENYAREVPALRESGVLIASVGDARVASATRRDLAQAVGAVLTTDGHVGKTYELSGDEAWTYADLAAAFSEVLGRDVVYKPVSSEEHLELLKDAGVPEQSATMIVAVDAGIGEGAFAYQNGDLARLLGRPTTPLVDGLRPHV